jgi:hypothetical protein
MKKATLLLVLILVLVTSLPVLADGMVYWSENVPPEIPSQRALLLFDGQQETLILQSRYQVPESTIDGPLGWVVPVPSVPELASVDADVAASLFAELNAATTVRPRQIRILYILLLASAFLLPVGSILALLACWLSFYVPGLHFVQRHRKGLIVGAFLVLVPSACACLGVYIYPRSFYNASPPLVEVIKAEQVGIYDVQVVEAHQAGDLIGWLNQNRFQFDKEDTQVFDEYVRRGWCFVVARIDPSSGTGEQVVSGGLAAPLIMRFPVEAPVYPLVLTSTSGHETQIRLYLFSEHKWQNDGRLNLYYARRTRLPRRDELLSDVEPERFFSQADLALPYLCGFTGTLSPGQMRADLSFTLAEDDDPYPKRVVVW